MGTRLHLSVVSGSLMVALTGTGCTDPVSAPSRSTPLATEPEQLLRIHDFSPVSEANPVVARIVDTPIVVPMSELRAYFMSELSQQARRDLDPKTGMKYVERLIDELVLLRDAYRQKVDRREPIAAALEGTRRMLLAEFLTREEVGARAKSAEQYSTLQAALEERLFEEAEIVVSNEAYAALEQAVARHGAGVLDELPADLAARPLARCGEMKVAVGDVFSMYEGLPPGKRPDIAKPEALSGLLEQLLADGLKVAEARKRGLDRSRQYREAVAANRAALTRMWLQDRITDEATEQMKAPETEARLRQWYDENRATRYTYRDVKGVERVMSFEVARHSVRGEYFDILRERIRARWAGRLREGLKVEIDEQLVAAATASGRPPTP